jgi:hypothetical protein
MSLMKVALWEKQKEEVEKHEEEEKHEQENIPGPANTFICATRRTSPWAARLANNLTHQSIGSY